MRNPLVSIIIPTFNASLCIERCLDSIFRQSFSRYEVIVIDDGSTDLTYKILEKYAGLIVYSSQINRGPSVARNHGLRLAKGDYIAFLDADDYWLPDFLLCCLEYFKNNPEIDAVSTGQKIISWKSNISINPPFLLEFPKIKSPIILDDFFHFWAEQDHIRTGCCMIRKKLIDRAGGMREDLRLAEDLEYWGYLATFGKWGFIPEILWVGDARAGAKGQGWLTKNRLRRKTCPSVEEWQQRIFPKIGVKELNSFSIVRGRVAQSFTYAKLLGGDIMGARDIAKQYGPEFPLNSLSSIFWQLASYNIIIWKIISISLLFREALKSWCIRLIKF